MTASQQNPAHLVSTGFRNKIRIVTAASLFDGHDAAINLMRRLMQASGAEVIHLGHNRSVADIVDCAIQEDVQGIAVTSYQGGHLEFFKYIYDLLQERGAGHIKIFGGGGGTILPSEIDELHAYGIARIYSPDDGRAMGLQGMIDDLLQQCDFELPPVVETQGIAGPPVQSLQQTIARLISTAENHSELFATPTDRHSPPVLGITGPGGAGKSSLMDELVLRFLRAFPDKTLAILSVDPSKRKTGGALLGDRIRMNAISPPADGASHVYMRSLATRQSNRALSQHVQAAIDVCKAAPFDLILVETSGIGQSDTEITEHVDKTLYVMTAEYGAATQLEKIDMLDFADVIAINKFDKRGSQDALRDVRKQYRRNHNRWDVPDDDLPIIGTVAAQFNDAGMNVLFDKLMDLVGVRQGGREGREQGWQGTGNTRHSHTIPANHAIPATPAPPATIIPPDRVRYLAEIVEESRRYDTFINEQTALARQLYQLDGVIKNVLFPTGETPDSAALLSAEARALLERLYADTESRMNADCRNLLHQWPDLQKRYASDYYAFQVRDKVIRQPLFSETLSHLKIPKVSLPKYNDWGDILRWLLTENVPGAFPYTAGVFPLKREGEDPTRMFAGEGGPERTNRRFHYVSKGLPAKRLSTAFDSVTLYGEDPALRPDIFGKIGNSGVSVCTLDDAKKLYSGFDLCDPATSVSMTINGPAPMLLGFFLNAAIDQQCEKWLRAEGRGVRAEGEGVRAEGVGHGLQGVGTTSSTPNYTNPAPSALTPAPPTHTNPAPYALTPPSHIHTNPAPSALTPAPPTHTNPAPSALTPLPPAPSYNAPLPDGNDGLGLLLLGTTGDKVLPPEVYEQIKADTLRKVRGTVQADILKEDQAQNTCIFSTEFALKMMGDIQHYFIDKQIQNFYSVSISGYHIAEAGANPISQLAFTLSNGFTFVEYYLSRGMRIDDFAPNLSFFFSNGMDPEYTVLGRVARRIWAKAMKHTYKASERSQKLKYHIQTSGRSLHAQEIAFNDIRTTLQALLAIYDNCNSLHTNAYDEAITTPTEESVRRAMAIQLIINREFGLTKNENPLQGSFIVEELTDLVEEAVYQEFLSINERGGVLGAMERMYQRSKIQEESMYFETLKHNGQLPVVGVNTFLNPAGSPTLTPAEVIRSSADEKRYAVTSCEAFQERNRSEADLALGRLQATVLASGNIFESLMEATKVCSLGQLSRALYAVGGQYRRNM